MQWDSHAGDPSYDGIAGAGTLNRLFVHPGGRGVRFNEFGIVESRKPFDELACNAI
jgi:hypothetical protein